MEESSNRQACELESAFNLFKRTNFGIKDDSILKRSERFTLLLISTLIGDQPATTSLIAEKLGVTLAAVTHHINSLEQEGLVQRSLSGGDRRVTFIALTKRGKQKIDELKKVHWRNMCDLVEYLGPEDTKQLVSLLGKITVFNTKRKERQC